MSELSTILPHAGGPYSFARGAMGRFEGFITGIGVLLQYIIAGPVVAIGMGGYVDFLFPEIPALVPAAIIFGIFMIVHIIDIKAYATIEMVYFLWLLDY
ncbi:amino acid permease [Lysinibacillus sp. NPDC056232]|uniref:amino acid permease n=1 Tax=Lysinibacillus sp. NPDC056232 TaxID=3345756 RepID=UPI0035E0F87D